MGVAPYRQSGQLRSVALALAVGLSAALGGCHAGFGQATVRLGIRTSQRAAGDASVYIDEQYVGPLGFVSARGVRLPAGEHRVTIKEDGYFPWDRLVEAGDKPIVLDVELVRVPD